MDYRVPVASSVNTKLLLGQAALAWMATFACGDANPDAVVFQRDVQPLLHHYCVGCHGDQKSEANIRIDRLDPNIVDGEHFDTWEDVREAFNSGEMPPDDQRQPTAAERDLITRWLDDEFKKAKLVGVADRRGSVRRLTRYELRYAIEDLLGVSAKDEVSSLPEEGISVETGLKNSSRMLMISGPHLESYLDVIINVIHSVKEIAALQPYSESVDIARLDPNPPQAFTRDNKKIKATVNKTERQGSGVVLAPGGYIDLSIPSISKYVFETSLLARAGGSSEIRVDIGFTRSDIDPRQNVVELGSIEISPSDELRRYSLQSRPDDLPRQMTRALDRPFFVRITNRGRQKVYLESFDYQGNINSELIEMLIPANVEDSRVDVFVRESIGAFIEQAFRRPSTNAELDRYSDRFRKHRMDEEPIAALLSTFKEILCSPSFCYLGVPGELSGEAKRNYKLAERLAFFLWCSVPDRELLKLAASGKLATPAVLAEQVDRMLEDEKSRRWAEQFADQWLQTSMLFNVAVDRSYYPRFKDPYKELMRQETIEAVNDVFRGGAPAIELLDAEHVFCNQTLAAYYQIRGVKGNDFRKVSLPKNDPRGGLLTQPTFLIGNSDGMNSHAILRGVWLADVILNDPPPDPPKNVPPLDESIPGFDKMTLNQKLFAHRNNDACKNCHQKIDPWGIAFENFDAAGLWRDKVLVISKETVEKEVAGKKRKRKQTILKKSFVGIDRTATLPDQVTVDGIGELKRYLVTHRKRDFATGLTKRILAYALSRDIDFYDEDLLNELVDGFEQNNYSVPRLIRDIVQSEQFQTGSY